MPTKTDKPQQNRSKPIPADPEFTRCVKRIFDTPEGRYVMKIMEDRMLNRPVDRGLPRTQDQVIEHLTYRARREGQNDVVHQLKHELEREMEEPKDGRGKKSS